MTATATRPTSWPVTPPRTTVPDGPPARTTTLTMAKALNEALRHALADDPKTLVMGEDVGRLGGVFRVTDGLHAQFGDDRVVDTPLAESGIVGTAIGLAMRGWRPVLEVQFDGFVFPAFDQIVSQLARMHYRSRGRLTLPVVVRIPYGGGIGAIEHHSESPEVLFAHTPGLRVVSPSTPDQAYSMLRAAVACPDPVLFFEPKAKYWGKGEVDLDAGVDPFVLDTARVVRPGSDVTVVAYGPTVATALAVADASEASVEVIDLRTLSPLDVRAVAASVRRTGRCVVVHEAPVLYGTGAEVAAQITEECFYYLQAPVLRVGGYHTPYPVATAERDWLPSAQRVADAVARAVAF